MAGRSLPQVNGAVTAIDPWSELPESVPVNVRPAVQFIVTPGPLMMMRSVICRVTSLSDTVPVIAVDSVSVTPSSTMVVRLAIMPVAALPTCVTVNVCPLPVHVPVSVWLTGAGVGMVEDVAVGAVGSIVEGAVGDDSPQATAAMPVMSRTAV